MLYIVAGYMRSGTTMMMEALEAGGLKAEYWVGPEDMKTPEPGEFFDPNQSLLYELHPQAYKAANFPRPFDGKLIKCLGYTTGNMAVMPNGISIVFMRRDPDEIHRSYLNFFGIDLVFAGQVDEMMDDLKERILNRRDVKHFAEFEYRDVVANPRIAFTCLKSTGWPVDIEKAIAVVDPNKVSVKKEELEFA